MKAAIIERKVFGGTCVNSGCLPAKTVVASAYAARVATRGAEYGVDVGPVRVDMKRVKARNDAVSAASRTGLEGWLRNMKHCPACASLLAMLVGRRSTRASGPSNKRRDQRAP